MKEDERNNAAPMDGAEKELWVWMLTVEDITELEQCSNLWSSKAGAKAAMERSIAESVRVWRDEGLALIRDDDEHACLGERMTWSIRKVKVHS